MPKAADTTAAAGAELGRTSGISGTPTTTGKCPYCSSTSGELVRWCEMDSRWIGDDTDDYSTYPHPHPGVGEDFAHSRGRSSLWLSGEGDHWNCCGAPVLSPLVTAGVDTRNRTALMISLPATARRGSLPSEQQEYEASLRQLRQYSADAEQCSALPSRRAREALPPGPGSTDGVASPRRSIHLTIPAGALARRCASPVLAAEHDSPGADDGAGTEARSKPEESGAKTGACVPEVSSSLPATARRGSLPSEQKEYEATLQQLQESCADNTGAPGN